MKTKPITKIDIIVGESIDKNAKRKNNNKPVRIDLGDYGKWNTFGVHGFGEYRIFNRDKGLPQNFPYNVNTYTGFGGVLLIMGKDNEGNLIPYAYDLSCPIENVAKITIMIDTNNFDAICSECNTHYNVINGTGDALNGTEKLKKYKMYQTSNGGYIITSF